MSEPPPDTDGLVVLPPAQPPAARVGVGVAACVFLGAILLSAAVDAIAPLQAPVLVGAEAKEFERLDEEARWLDGSKARRIAVHGRLSSRVRQTLGPIHTALSLRYLGETGSEGVLAGKDGWFFLDKHIGLPAKGQTRPSIDRSAALLAAVERRITARGTRFIAVPIPRKSAVLRDYAPAGAEPFAAMEDELLGRLQEFGVEAVDLRPAFEGIEPRDRYLKYDSHWAQVARVRSAEVLVNQAGRRAPEPSTRLVEVPWTTYHTDILRYAGIPDDSWVRDQMMDDTEVTFELRQQDPLPDGVPSPTPRIGAVTDRMPPLALFGTSFSRRLGDYVAHFSDTPVFDGSQPGGFFLDSLANLRQCYNFGAWPEVLWYEFPVFKAFSLGRAQRRTLSASQGFSLSVLPIIETSPLPVERSAVSGDRRLWIGRGHLITSGNGIASVRVVRQGGGPGEGLWGLQVANLTMEVPWHAARQELLLPIVATDDLGAEVKLIAKSNGAPTMKVDAALVTDLDLDAQIDGTPAPPQGSAARSVAFPGVTLERHSALVAQLDLGAWQGPIELRTRTEDGSVAFWSAHAAGHVTVVLDLSRHTGKALASFEVAAPGAPTPWKITSAAWAPQIH